MSAIPKVNRNRCCLRASGAAKSLYGRAARIGLSHLFNDAIQSLIPAVYPILKNEFALDFVQIGMITLTFQIAGALFQPAIGLSRIATRCLTQGRE